MNTGSIGARQGGPTACAACACWAAAFRTDGTPTPPHPSKCAPGSLAAMAVTVIARRAARCWGRAARTRGAGRGARAAAAWACLPGAWGSREARGAARHAAMEGWRGTGGPKPWPANLRCHDGRGHAGSGQPHMHGGVRQQTQQQQRAPAGSETPDGLAPIPRSPQAPPSSPPHRDRHCHCPSRALNAPWPTW